MEPEKKPNITIAIPCYNEELTIAKVVAEFRGALSDAAIAVFDNNSTDRSAELARAAGAQVYCVKKQGKGNVLRSIFENINSDVVVMVDGDDTYFANDVHGLLAPVMAGEADMVVGNRFAKSKDGMSASHSFGNWLICRILNFSFKTDFKDVLSGYRVFSKNFYKNTYLFTKGFEIETELTLRALEKENAIVEVPISYKNRPEGSQSKIREFSDGSRIIFTIGSLLRDFRPISFFSTLGSILVVIGLVFGLRVVVDYINTGLVLRLPTAVLSITFIILGFNAFLSGLSVSATNSRNQELEEILKRIKNNNL